MPRRERRAHDDLDDRRREAIDFVDGGDESVVERAGQRAPLCVALLLRFVRAVHRHQRALEQARDVREAVLRGGHGLDDVAGVLRMIVAVERDQLLAPRRMLIGGEETAIEPGFVVLY